MANECAIKAGNVVNAARNRGSPKAFNEDKVKQNTFVNALRLKVAKINNSKDQGIKVEIADEIAALLNESLVNRTNAYVGTNEWRNLSYAIVARHFNESLEKNKQVGKYKGAPVKIVDYRRVPEAALTEIREMLATVVGGNVHVPGRTVAPIPGIHQMSAQIADDIILKSGTQRWLADATFGTFGGIRGPAHKREDMKRLRAMFGDEKVDPDIRLQAEKLNALADASSNVRSRLLGFDRVGKLQTKVLLQLPMGFTDLQTIGRDNFIKLAASGKYRLGSNKDAPVLKPELAGIYYDHLSNDFSIADETIENLEKVGLYAVDPDSHRSYIKAAGARSFVDTMMGNVARLGIEEASVRALGTTPGKFIDNLIAFDKTEVMTKVFRDTKFRAALQNGLNRATGYSDSIGFQPWYAKYGFGLVSVGRTVGNALALKDAPLSVLADLPLRSSVNAAFGKNFADKIILVNIIKDLAGQLRETFRFTGTSREQAARHNQILEAEWQDVIGSGQFLDQDRALHLGTRYAQKFAGLFHTASGFRAANVGAQIRANGEFLLKVRSAIEQSNGNWDSLPQRLQQFLNDNYLIDKHTFAAIAKVANIDAKGIDIFDFENMNDFLKTRLQVGMRQNLHQSTGRANPFQIASSFAGEGLTAKRGTTKREIFDTVLPFISPLVNQITMIRGLYNNIAKLPNGANKAALMTEFFATAGIAYLAYGIGRVVYSDYANGRDIDPDDWASTDPEKLSEKWVRASIYGLVPMLGFYYGGVSDELHGFHGSDIAQRVYFDVLSGAASKTDFLADPFDIEEADFVEWLKTAVPSYMRVTADWAEMWDKEKS